MRDENNNNNKRKQIDVNSNDVAYGEHSAIFLYKSSGHDICIHSLKNQQAEQIISIILR